MSSIRSNSFTVLEDGNHASEFDGKSKAYDNSNAVINVDSRADVSFSETRERRAAEEERGLCYRIYEKFKPNHNYSNKELQVLLVKGKMALSN